MPARAWRRAWCGADVSFLPILRGARRRWRPARPWYRQRRLCSGRHYRPSGTLLGRVGQLHRPRPLLAGIDLEEPGAGEAARQAIVGAADGELLVARAHEGAAGPFAAAAIIDRVDVIVTRDQRAAQQRFAGTRRDVPPAFGGPAFGVLVADRDADPAAGIVAEAEVGISRRRGDQHEHSGGPEGSGTQTQKMPGCGKIQCCAV